MKADTQQVFPFITEPTGLTLARRRAQGRGQGLLLQGIKTGLASISRTRIQRVVTGSLFLFFFSSFSTRSITSHLSPFRSRSRSKDRKKDRKRSRSSGRSSRDKDGDRDRHKRDKERDDRDRQRRKDDKDKDKDKKKDEGKDTPPVAVALPPAVLEVKEDEETIQKREKLEAWRRKRAEEQQKQQQVVTAALEGSDSPLSRELSNNVKEETPAPLVNMDVERPEKSPPPPSSSSSSVSTTAAAAAISSSPSNASASNVPKDSNSELVESEEHAPGWNLEDDDEEDGMEVENAVPQDNDDDDDDAFPKFAPKKTSKDDDDDAVFSFAGSLAAKGKGKLLVSSLLPKALGKQPSPPPPQLKGTPQKPASQVHGGGDDDDEVDPLDAYMLDVVKEVEDLTKADTSASGTLAAVTMKGTPAATAAPAPAKTREGSPNPEDEDGPVPEKLLTEEELWNLTQQKNKKKELHMVDHSAVQYESFRKVFYNETPEIAKMSAEDLKKLREDLDGIKIRGNNCPKPLRNWAQAGLNLKIEDVLKKSGFEGPTPIQAQAIPAIMSGRDVIGVAKTGSGKTLAFLLPMFRHIMDQHAIEEGEGPIGLVLTPTRELAMQIFSEAKKFTKVLKLRVKFSPWEKKDNFLYFFFFFQACSFFFFFFLL